MKRFFLLFEFLFFRQQVQAHMIIIIHPGSLNLRIGRASDLNPHRILNAIARRRTPGGSIYRDAVHPPSIVKVCVQISCDCRNVELVKM